MAVDVLPPTWITGWSEDATDVSFPLDSLDELEEAEADATGGDFRKCMFAICEHVYQHYAALATADKPAKMTITSSSSINATTNAVTKSYTFNFTLDVAGLEVAAE
jgi:hypothetical protein